MHKSFVLLAAVACLTSPIAFAQNALPMYGEITTARVTLKDTSSDHLGTFQPRTVRLTLGQVVGANMAVEEFAYLSSSNDAADKAANNPATKVSKKQDSLYGIALRPFVNVTPSFELFARLGIARSEIKTTSESTGQSQTTTATATNSFYGGGASYALTRAVKVTVDFSKFANKNETQLSNVNLGLRFNF